MREEYVDDRSDYRGLYQTNELFNETVQLENMLSQLHAIKVS